MTSRDIPTLILNPIGDEEFVRRALQLLVEAATASDLQVALREYYPNAVVRRRDLAGEGESWYVYRDGSWVPPAARGAGG